jgi:hypothetical protein
MTAPVQVVEIRRLDGSGNGQEAWVALPQTPGCAKADGSGAGWFPVVEITNLIERGLGCLDQAAVARARRVRVCAGDPLAALID